MRTTQTAPLFQTQRASYAIDRAANHVAVAYKGLNTADERKARAIAATRTRANHAPKGLFAHLVAFLFGL